MIRLLLVLLLTILCGSALVWAGLAGGRPTRLLPLQKGFAGVLLGVMVSGWWALTLAEFNRFSLLSWAVGLVVIAGVGAFWGWRQAPRRRPFDQRAILATVGVILLLTVAGWVIGPPFEYVIGGRDHGVYVNTGIHMSRSGGILVEEPEFAALSPAARAVLSDPRTDALRAGLPGPWSEGQRLVGITIRSGKEGIFAPHAFHLYPAYFALVYAAGGLEITPTVVLAFGLLGLWAVFMTADLVFGRWIAWGTAALLSVHVTTHWFARYPTAEQLVQLLFWGGMWFFLLWLRDRRALYAIAAGGAFGLLHLAKLDTIFVPPFLLLFYWVDRAYFKNERRWRPFWVVYGVLTAQAIWHGWQIATIYTIDHLVRTLLPGFLAEPLRTAASGLTDPNQILGQLLREGGGRLLFLVLLGAAFLWLINRPLPLTRVNLRPESPPMRWLGAVTAGGAILLFLIIDLLSPSFGKNAPTIMLAYTGGLVIVLALIGISSRLWRATDPGEWFLWGMIAIHIVPFLLLGLGTAPDHFWAIRRLIVVYFPAVMLAAVVGLNVFQLRDRRWRGFQPLWLGGAIILLAIPYLASTARFWRVTEYEGVIKQLQLLDAQLPDRSIILFTASPEAVEIGTPLWLALGHPTYLVEEDEIQNPALSEAINGWISENRSVYWVASPQLTALPPQTIAIYKFTSGWMSPIVVSQPYVQPDTIGERLYLFDFYRLSNSAVDSQTVYTIPLYAGDPPQVVSGLHQSESRPGALPLRWTTGDLVLSFPYPNSASRLVVMMGNPRPPGTPSPLTDIFVDGHHIGQVIPAAQPEAVTFDLSGLGLSGSAADPLEVVFRTAPWQPASLGISPDERPLGIYVPWVKYVTKP